MGVNTILFTLIIVAFAAHLFFKIQHGRQMNELDPEERNNFKVDGIASKIIAGSIFLLTIYHISPLIETGLTQFKGVSGSIEFGNAPSQEPVPSVVSHEEQVKTVIEPEPSGRASPVTNERLIEISGGREDTVALLQ